MGNSRKIVVIGASAGGISAVIKVIAGLSCELNLLGADAGVLPGSLPFDV